MSCGLAPVSPAPEVFVTSACRVAVCALWIHSAGHALPAVGSWVKLTFESDHQTGADQQEDEGVPADADRCRHGLNSACRRSHALGCAARPLRDAPYQSLNRLLTRRQ